MTQTLALSAVGKTENSMANEAGFSPHMHTEERSKSIAASQLPWRLTLQTVLYPPG